MPNPYFKVGWISKRENNYNKRPVISEPAKLVNYIPKILIMLEGEFYNDEENINYNYIKYLITDKLLSTSDIFDLYFGTLNGENIINDNLNTNINIVVDDKKNLNNNLGNLITYFYNKGYRNIISTHHSNTLIDALPVIDNYKDLLVLNVSSSVAFDEDIKIPLNLFRTSENDIDTLTTLFLEILPNFYSYLKISGESILYTPLENSQEPNKISFGNLIYIYISGSYTLKYLKIIEYLLSTFDIKINLIPIEINKGQPLSNEAKYYLTYNNISSVNYSTSSDKPLIILNSYNIEDLLQLLDNERYYDNYTLFTQRLKIHTRTLFKFKYAFRITPNYSSMGYRLSYNIDPTQSVYPEILSIYDIYKDIDGFFDFESILKSRRINVAVAIKRLMDNGFYINNKWQRNLSSLQTLRYISIPDENNLYPISFRAFFIKDKFLSPRAITIMTPETNTLDNNVVDDNLNLKSFNLIDNVLLNYNENINRINNIKPNIDNLLDNTFEIFVNNNNKQIFINYLYQNYDKKLNSINFTQQYIINKTNIYNIPVINLDIKDITEYVDYTVVTSDSELLSDNSIKITLPEIKYYVYEYFYDLNTKSYINKLFNLYNEEKYQPIEIELFTNVDNLELELFKGNILRIGNYDSINNIFNTIESIRSFVIQKFNINWLIIQNNYKIGDMVYIIQTHENGIVKSISENRYYITVNKIYNGFEIETLIVYAEHELFSLSNPLPDNIPD